MKELVKKNFNLDLVREVRFIGKFNTPGFDKGTIIW
jgi:hypothetical protein